jgi:talin
VKEFLPQCYTKLKNIEKRIFLEHSKHVSKSEIDTKVEYCKLARELKTYGVSFFLVKVSPAFSKINIL